MLQWIWVGLIVLAAVLMCAGKVKRMIDSKGKNSGGCCGCSLKDNCSVEKKDQCDKKQ